MNSPFWADRSRLAVGRRWFCRDNTKQPARYSHGGVSLAEMVVPAVALKRVTSKSARATLEDTFLSVTSRLESNE